MLRTIKRRVISRLFVLAAPRGQVADTYTENNNVNLSSDVNPTTSVQENNNDSDCYDILCILLIRNYNNHIIDE